MKSAPEIPSLEDVIARLRACEYPYYAIAQASEGAFSEHWLAKFAVRKIPGASYTLVRSLLETLDELNRDAANRERS